MSILRILGRRLASLVPLVLGIVLFVFAVMQFSATDPAIAVFADAPVTPDQLDQFREEHGLNDPFLVRYFGFLLLIAQGQLGRSLATGEQVTSMISTALPLTVQLTLLGLAIAVVVALVLGIISAIFRDRWPDQVIRFVSLLGVAAPSFWVALLLIQWFAIDRAIFPTGGYINPSDSVTGWLRTMALPAFSLGFPVAAQLTRIIRTSMVEELDRDYVRTARGGGLPPWVVVGRNVLRNALINPLNVLGLRVGYLLGGAVVIEQMFNLPGMGRLMIEGVKNNEPAIVQGAVLTIALGFVVVNLLVDVLSLLVNPKLRSQKA
ncbi:ABC transporter permease [Micropruina sonneratiae]|uniref:ABC transporter permease n=1 Tax=Micropruina sonneratiae TaxID=2986940 RepID=UPI002225D0E1|nr:ABC transporter permease [Micropruina sp. KQZ13P-5]MCW3156967.1 ABC transporter permease [Micropruina sp. KQZ13P-5]